MNFLSLLANGTVVADFEVSTVGNVSFNLAPDGSGGTDITVSAPCYARGTRIGTPTGQRLIEDLRTGDLVLTAAGRAHPIIWTGSRSIDISLHPQTELVQPIVIRAHAFAANQPSRDLVLSPDHNLSFEDVLIPAKCLVNGLNVQVLDQTRVTYHHIELAAHALILAEGLPAETFLNVGNRAELDPGASGHADFSSSVDLNWFTWEAEGCAPLALVGPEVDRARKLLSRRAQRAIPAQLAAA